jgi:signal peptidase I
MFKKKSARAQASPGGWPETLKTVFYAVLIAVVFRTVAYEPFNIPSGSMKPTLLIGDYLFVAKFAYGYSRHSLPWSLPLITGRVLSRPPERGDVAVFKWPRDNSTDYIKRIVGLPGDRIQMKNGALYINGRAVKRERIELDNPDRMLRAGPGVAEFRETLPNGVSYRTFDAGNTGADNTRVITVPPGQYFMMGDNRDRSSDSRVWGPVKAENLVGRAEVLFFSTNGSARMWEFWRWPTSTRYSRMFRPVE